MGDEARAPAARGSAATCRSGLLSRGFGPCTWLEQAACELGAGLHPELAEGFAQMVVDGARADEQLSGDLPVRGPLCHEAGDLRFLRGQVVAPVDGAVAGVLPGR